MRKKALMHAKLCCTGEVRMDSFDVVEQVRRITPPSQAAENIMMKSNQDVEVVLSQRGLTAVRYYQ